jgi:hypothetical protein
MDEMLASFRQPRPAVLLPDFTGDDYSALETSVLALVPTTPEQLADIEQAVEAASADPENRELLARITDRLPSRTQLAGLTPWAVFVMVSLEMLKVAPEINPNDIGVLTIILMVVLYLHLAPQQRGPLVLHPDRDGAVVRPSCKVAGSRRFMVWAGERRHQRLSDPATGW